MKKYITILSVMMLALSVSSCKFVRINVPADFVRIGGENSSEGAMTFAPGAFNAMDIQVPADIHYYQNEDEPSVSILAKQSVLDAISVKVEDSVLVVTCDKAIINGKVDIAVNSASLSAIKVSGAADFEALNGIKADSFSIDVNGAGDILIHGLKANDVAFTVKGAGDLEVQELDCHDLGVLIQGAGDVVLVGKAETADMLIQGAGDIDAEGLECNHLTKDIQGIGKIHLR